MEELESPEKADSHHTFHATHLLNPSQILTLETLTTIIDPDESMKKAVWLLTGKTRT